MMSRPRLTRRGSDETSGNPGNQAETGVLSEPLIPSPAGASGALQSRPFVFRLGSELREAVVLLLIHGLIQERPITGIDEVPVEPSAGRQRIGGAIGEDRGGVLARLLVQVDAGAAQRPFPIPDVVDPN